MPILIFH
jgi:hypothetical protein